MTTPQRPWAERFVNEKVHFDDEGMAHCSKAFLVELVAQVEQDAVERERERIADWLEDEQIQFPQMAGWEKTFEAFKRAAQAIRLLQ